MAGPLKRKRDGGQEPKFYAVRVGRTPGIYHNWQECFTAVSAFPNAAYKSFGTESDAQAYLNGKDSTIKPKPTAHKSAWYAVRQGRTPGIYTSWKDVESQIRGFKDATFKKFASKNDAEQFMGDMAHLGLATAAAISADSLPLAKKNLPSKGRNGKVEHLSAADVDLSEHLPGEAPLPVETEDGFDSTIILDEKSGALRYRTEEEQSRHKPQVARPVEGAPIIIHTDGSTLSNGRDAAISGVGVYFGPADTRNVSETLAGKKQTNQRAELTALIRALELAPKDRKLIIRSDSKYAIQCVTEWFVNWRQNNWQTSQRKTVDNKDLIIKIIDLLEERVRINSHRRHAGLQDIAGSQHWERGPASVRFDWVKGHSVHEGNQAADLLAVQGAQKARELDEMANDDVDI